MWTGLTMEESIRMEEDRDKWRKYVHVVANPRIEDSWRTELIENFVKTGKFRIMHTTLQEIQHGFDFSNTMHTAQWRLSRGDEGDRSPSFKSGGIILPTFQAKMHVKIIRYVVANKYMLLPCFIIPPLPNTLLRGTDHAYHQPICLLFFFHFSDLYCLKVPGHPKELEMRGKA